MDPEDGTTALYVACEAGSVEVTANILGRKGINVNARTYGDRHTPLSIAITEGHSKNVKLLLDHDEIDVDKIAFDESPPLFLACCDCRVEIVTLLLAHTGIDVNQVRTEDGCSPLLYSCQAGHVMIATLLLAHEGIDVNNALGDGTTPLAVACEMGHTAIIKVLLAHDGIDANKAPSVESKKDHPFNPLSSPCMQQWSCRGGDLVAGSQWGGCKYGNVNTGFTPTRYGLLLWTRWDCPAVVGARWD